MTQDYQTIAQVDVGLGRAALRRAQYVTAGLPISANGQAAVIDRLLDRRLVLMAERDAGAAGRTNP